MKLMKKIVAAVIVSIMALSVTACHKKGEIAVTVNGIEFTSGYYMAALIDSYLQAQDTVYSSLSDTTSEINYFKQSIEGKKFEVWVKDEALELLKENATYKKLCKDNKLEISDEKKSEAEYMAYYYWNYYGYAGYYEPNGVSYATYSQFMVDTYYQALYFDFLYGKDGEKEIAAADVEKKLYDNFIIADLIEVTFDDETAKEKEALKEKLDGYVADLKSKKKTFEEVYKDYNKTDETEDTESSNNSTASDTSSATSDATSSTTSGEEEKELEPLDSYAQILGAKDSGYDHDYFTDINKMATNEIKLIEKAENKGYYLVVKKDIKADPYYLDYLDSTVRHLLKDDEFTKDMEKLFKEAKADVNSFAVDRFKVKNIKEPS